MGKRLTGFGISRKGETGFKVLPMDKQGERLQRIKIEATKLRNLVEVELLEGFESTKTTTHLYNFFHQLKKFISDIENSN